MNYLESDIICSWLTKYPNDFRIRLEMASKRKSESQVPAEESEQLIIRPLLVHNFMSMSYDSSYLKREQNHTHAGS